MPRSPMSLRSFNSSQRDLTTPKASYIRPASALSVRHGTAMSKRRGTPAFEYLNRHEVPATIHGGHRFKGTYRGAPIVDDFDMVLRDDAEDPDASFDGMDNVRGESHLHRDFPLANAQPAVMANTLSEANTVTIITTTPTRMPVRLQPERKRRHYGLGLCDQGEQATRRLNLDQCLRLVKR